MKIETKEYKSKTCTIFNQRLAGWLMLRGFVLIDVKPNDNKSGRNVFFFRDSTEIKTAMQEYLSKA